MLVPRPAEGLPLRNGPNVTLIAALSPDGLGALLSGNGAVIGALFTAYLDQVLGPTRRPGDVVVLDNLAVHKVDGLHEIAKNTMCACATCLLTRRISTRLNSPFNKLKTWLHTAKARTRDLLEEAILAAAAWITE